MGFFQNLYDSPPLILGEGTSFHDFYGIADMAFVIFIMSLEFSGPFHGFLVQAMGNHPLNGNDDGFFHFVADYFANTVFALISLLGLYNSLLAEFVAR